MFSICIVHMYTICTRKIHSSLGLVIFKTTARALAHS